ncbi:sulfate ABC transporter permease subunit CysT [Martelella sp. AD-3]|uniref:sulfate ABC transporter permease subunit CysT n=1 Tax=Martelella sp. AD-3 TaxID=686597 RepID=UPI0004632A9A|nr:sulfate ABC transporter permease subunit CysT [Martelella sp. AD-3]AMM86889.1 sulfate/thiosulfate transporter subunit [Martelella sp. AD-3]MAM10838.1 sulfate ABC transporter permease subunit CysT [Rhizobiaceae bacterium]
MPTANRGASRRVMPGFGLTLGVTLLFTCLIILLPLSALFFQLGQLGFGDYWRIISSDRTLAAFRVTISAALTATVFNACFGLLLAWVIVRYKFPGKRLLDALIDLPFALPTAVAGIALVALYDRNGWMGMLLAEMNIKVAYTWWGIAIAMTFTSVPFGVRTVQPVMESLRTDLEEAAQTLGASDRQVFRHIIFPQLWPSFIMGASLAFARSLGEFGAVIFIAGNMPYKTEIASLLIMIRLDEYDFPAASAIAGTLLLLALAVLIAANIATGRAGRHLKRGG